MPGPEQNSRIDSIDESLDVRPVRGSEVLIMGSSYVGGMFGRQETKGRMSSRATRNALTIGGEKVPLKNVDSNPGVQLKPTLEGYDYRNHSHVPSRKLGQGEGLQAKLDSAEYEGIKTVALLTTINGIKNIKGDTLGVGEVDGNVRGHIQGLQNIIDAVVTTGRNIVISTVPYTKIHKKERTDSINAQIKKLGSQSNVFVYDLNPLVAHQGSYDENLLSGDGYHLNAKGYKKTREGLQAFLNRVPIRGDVLAKNQELSSVERKLSIDNLLDEMVKDIDSKKIPKQKKESMKKVVEKLKATYSAERRSVIVDTEGEIAQLKSGLDVILERGLLQTGEFPPQSITDLSRIFDSTYLREKKENIVGAMDGIETVGDLETLPARTLVEMANDPKWEHILLYACTDFADENMPIDINNFRSFYKSPKAGSRIQINFRGNSDWEAQIGFADIAPPSVRTITVYENGDKNRRRVSTRSSAASDVYKRQVE